MRYKYKFDFHIFAFPPINLINLSIKHKNSPTITMGGDTHNSFAACSSVPSHTLSNSGDVNVVG